MTDGGSKESTFEEGWLKADGKTAYCIQLGVAFQSGNKIRKNATERLSEAQINNVVLNLEYVKKHTKNYSAEQAYRLPMQRLLPKRIKTVMIAAAIATLARGRT